MGELAGVPIEPPSQTRLADATMSVPGCLFAGVPGGIVSFCLCIFVSGASPYSYYLNKQREDLMRYLR